MSVDRSTNRQRVDATTAAGRPRMLPREIAESGAGHEVRLWWTCCGKRLACTSLPLGGGPVEYGQRYRARPFTCAWLTVPAGTEVPQITGTRIVFTDTDHQMTTSTRVTLQMRCPTCGSDTLLGEAQARQKLEQLRTAHLAGAAPYSIDVDVRALSATRGGPPKG